MYQANRLPNPEQFSILIIDDDSDCRSLLSRRLLNEGYTVLTATDGIDATVMLSIEHFDLILLDLEMPRMNGFQFLEWLKINHPDIDSHVLVVSANCDRDVILNSLNLGAHDYLLKSASSLELLNRIQRACLARQLQKDFPKIEAADSIHDSHVMIVDDEELNRKLLARHLESNRITVRCFEDGHTLLSAIQTTLPDLVLLDIMMPDFDGIDILRTLREIYEPHELSIMMLTAIDDSKKIDECYKLGADDYLSKPFSAAELLTRVKTTLHLKQLSEEKYKLGELALLGQSLFKS